MQSGTWPSENDQCPSGRELFRSERRFSVWAYGLSHSQLLLRARTTTREGGRQSRIDIVFAPVEAMKTRMDYHGLVLRCATTEEHARIISETNRTADRQVLIIESGDTVDYVVAQGVGWQEDDKDDREPSDLALFSPGTDPTRLLASVSPVSWSAIQAARMRD